MANFNAKEHNKKGNGRNGMVRKKIEKRVEVWLNDKNLSYNEKILKEIEFNNFCGSITNPIRSSIINN